MSFFSSYVIQISSRNRKKSQKIAFLIWKIAESNYTMALDRLIHIDNRIRDIMHRFQPGGAGASGQKENGVNQTTHSDYIKSGADVSIRSKQASGSMNTFSGQLENLIERQAAAGGVSSDLVRAIIQAESSGNPQAISQDGAIGLMQLMPDTARSLGVNPRNPEENLMGGIEYLKQMAGRYGDLDKTLAAYNAGPGNVDKYGGVPPFRETKNYIQKVRSYLENASVDERPSYIDESH